MNTEPYIYRQPESRNFRGWLILFLIVCAFSAIMTIILGIIAFNIEDYEVGGGHIATFILSSIDVLYVAGIAGFGIFVIYSFMKRYPSAPLHGIIYCSLLLYSHLFQIFMAFLISEAGEESVTGDDIAARGILGCCIGIAYLLISKQIKQLFPHDKWKLSNSVLIAIVVIIFLPIIEFCLSILFSPADVF